MPDWTRRDLFRATAAATAAAAVPAVALRGSNALAASQPRPDDLDAPDNLDALDAVDYAAIAARGPIMVCVHDAEHGDVSILHGTSETVVRDRRLVAKIMRANVGSRAV